MSHGLTLCIDVATKTVSATGQVSPERSAYTRYSPTLHYLSQLSWEPERLHQHGKELIEFLPSVRKPALACWASAAVSVGRSLGERLPTNIGLVDYDHGRSASDLLPGQNICMRYLLTALHTADPHLLTPKTGQVVMAQVGKTKDGLLVLQFVRQSAPRARVANHQPRMSRRLSFG